MTYRLLCGRCGGCQRVHGAEDRPQPQFPGQAGDRRHFRSYGGPVGAVPVGRADLGRAGDGHDPLVRGAGGSLGEVDDPRAGAAGLAHELAHLLAALAQLAWSRGSSLRVTWAVARRSGRCFRHFGVSLVLGTDVPEGGGVRLAGARGARTHPALEVLVGGHRGGYPVFVHVSATASPASRPETGGPGWRPEIRSPFASMADRAGAGRRRFGVGHAGIHSGRGGLACQPCGQAAVRDKVRL